MNSSTSSSLQRTVKAWLANVSESPAQALSEQVTSTSQQLQAPSPRKRKRQVDQHSPSKVLDAVQSILVGGSEDGTNTPPSANLPHSISSDDASIPPPIGRGAFYYADSSSASEKSVSGSLNKSMLQHGLDKFYFHNFSIPDVTPLAEGLHLMKADIENYSGGLGILPSSCRVRTSSWSQWFR